MTSREPCCDSWEIAVREGSDSQGYGCLVLERIDGSIIAPDTIIGGHPHPVRFCPWCGRPKGPQTRQEGR